MEMSLKNIGTGVAIEKFDDELVKVINNILDPNTDIKTKREVQLIMKLIPNEEREGATIEIMCKSKLAPSKTVVSHAMIGVDKNGELHASEWNPKQKPLFDMSTDKKVLTMGK